jgi:hypothetical protein
MITWTKLVKNSDPPEGLYIVKTDTGHKIIVERFMGQWHEYLGNVENCRIVYYSKINDPDE